MIKAAFLALLFGLLFVIAGADVVQQIGHPGKAAFILVVLVSAGAGIAFGLRSSKKH